jgi:hypothetical protein
MCCSAQARQHGGSWCHIGTFHAGMETWEARPLPVLCGNRPQRAVRACAALAQPLALFAAVPHHADEAIPHYLPTYHLRYHTY